MPLWQIGLLKQRAVRSGQRHTKRTMANMTSTFTVNRLVNADAEIHAKDAIMHHPGIHQVHCDHQSNTIVVTYDSSQISTVRVEEAISQLGIMTIERHDVANV